MSNQVILLISNNKIIRKGLHKICQSQNRQLVFSNDKPDQMEKKVRQESPQLVVVDLVARRSAAFYTCLHKLQQALQRPYLFLLDPEKTRLLTKLSSVYPCAIAGKPLDQKQLPALINRMMAPPESRDQRQPGSQIATEQDAFCKFSELIPIPILIYCGNTIIYANPAAETITEYSQAELRRKNFWEIVHPEYQPLIKQRGLARQQGKAPPTHYGFKIISKSGREKWIYIYTYPFRFEHKNAIMLVGLDISDWKQAEQDLHESENKYRLLVENVNDAIVISQNDKFIYFNKQFPAMLGYDSRELMGADFKQVYTALGVKKLYARKKKRDQGKRVPQRYETCLRHKNGAEIWVEISSRIITYQGKIATFAVIRNIDRQKKALRHLEHERYLFHTLMENVTDAIYFKDKESRFIQANKVVARRFGFQDPAQLYGKTDFDFFLEPHAREAYADEQKIIQTQKPIINKEEKEAWPDGRVSWALTTKMPLYNENGEIVGTFGTGKDITSLKKIEAALRQSERNLEQIIQGSSVPMFVIDENHRVTHWNRAMENITRISADKVRGTSRHWKAFHSKRQPLLADLIIDGIPKKVIYKYQQAKIFKNPVIKGAYEGTDFFPKVGGRDRWIYYTAAPIKDSTGKVIAAVETLQDITQLKEAEAAINTQKQYFEALFNSSASAIVSLDQNDKILNINPKFEALFGYQKKEVRGKDIDALIAPAENYQEARKITACVAQGDIVHQEAVRYKKNGTPVHVTISGSPILVNGQQIGSLGIYADITERKQSEKELKAAKQEAEKANQAKNIFLANMSHELRTPMNAILGFTEILQATTVNKSQAQYLASIKSSGQMLLNLINDILDLSKIEAGRVELDYKPVNVQTIIKDITNTLKLKIQEKNLDLIVQTDPQLHPDVLVDEVRLRQILYNLVGNALKFTHRGYVKLTIKQLRENKKDHTIDLQFRVTDTGIGIPKDQQKLVFQAFFQQRGQDKAKYGGSGLGLSITKNLINQMGGSIILESELNRGSTFQFTLPNIQKASAGKERPEQARPKATQTVSRPVNILIFSNIPASIKLLSAYLDDPNFGVQTATNADQARQQLAQHSPDLIITDLKGQYKNGFKLLKMLKQELADQPRPLIPIISTANPQVKQALDELGCHDYLVKPVQQNELLQKIFASVPENKKVAAAADTKPIPDSSAEKWTDALKKQSGTNLRCLHNILQQDFVPLWKIIKQSYVINDIEEFARELGQIADQFQLPPLKAWSLNLIEATQNFDMESLPDILDSFQTILMKIKSRAKPHQNKTKGAQK